MSKVVEAFQDQKLIHIADRNYIVNPLTDHEPTTSYELVKDTIDCLTKLTDMSKITKILGEEDRGGFIATIMAYVHKLPFGMVKWNPIGLEGEIEVGFRNAYTSGKMYMHGVENNDKVLLVEDMVDTGGTIISMIDLLKKKGIDLVDIVVIAEKVEYEGIKRIKEETGWDVKHLLKFTSSGSKSKVVWIHDILKS